MFQNWVHNSGSKLFQPKLSNLRPSPLWTWFHLASCPGQRATNQVKTTSISWQVSRQISSHHFFGVFGIQLSDSWGVGSLLDLVLFCTFAFCVWCFAYPCTSGLIHSFPFILSVMWLSSTTHSHQVNMPLVAWLLSHPIFLESFEDTAFLDKWSNTGGFSNLETDEKRSPSTYVMTWIVDQFCIVHPCIQHQRTFFPRNQPSYLDFVATHNFSS